MHYSIPAFGMACASLLSAAAAQEATTIPACHLELPIVEITERYPPYAELCTRRPALCELEGARAVQHDVGLMAELERVNRMINQQVTFVLDSEQYGVEDFWAMPASGYGDCEDMALAKRQRLIRQGYPSAALRLAFVSNRSQPGAHCILTVQTTEGTFILDSRSDRVICWADSPYNFEARERPDGRWERYDQSLWQYEHPMPTLP